MVPVFRSTRLARWILLMMFTNRPVSLSCLRHTGNVYWRNRICVSLIKYSELQVFDCHACFGAALESSRYEPS